MEYNESLENIKLKYILTEEQFEKMYEDCRYITFHNCKKSLNPIGVFVGGQTGAGKGGIDVFSAREVLENGEHIAVLDVDVYRALHPYTKEILQKYPTMYSDITAQTTGKILKRIIAEAIENRYNFVFEGTLRNAEALETMKGMPKDFRKVVRVMATSNIESLLTAFERNYEQIKITGYGRFTNVETHNITYNGVLETIKKIETSGENITIELFKRGKDMVSPIKIFSTNEDNRLASEVLIDERRKDSEIFINERKQRFNYLLETLIPRDEFEEKQKQKLKEELSKIFVNSINE